LELIRHKDGSIVSISKISEVIMSKCSFKQQFLIKDICDIFRGSKHTLTPFIFSGGQDTLDPQDLRPWLQSPIGDSRCAVKITIGDFIGDFNCNTIITDRRC